MSAELFIENNKVDLTEDINIPINFNVSDIKDISKRKSDFSKTVSVAGTKNNNQLFGNIYEIQAVRSPSGAPSGNIGVNFNQKKKADFVLFSNGASVLSGTVQMQSVDIEDGKITYNIVLYGELNNFISTLGDSKLSDLTLTELTHDYTKENIVETWSGSTDYMYPLIDYGVVNARGESFTVNSLRPAVYAKYYWDKIFEESGFTYESEFINANLFSEIIIPYNRDGIGSEEGSGDRTVVEQSQRSVFDSDEQTDLVNLAVPQFDRVFDTEIEDSFDGYESGSLAYSASVDQRVDVTVNLLYSSDYELFVDTAGKNEDPLIAKREHNSTLRLYHVDNTNTVINTYTDIVSIDETQFNYISSQAFLSDTISHNIFQNISMEAGDRLYVDLTNDASDFENLSSTSYTFSGSVTQLIEQTNTNWKIEGSFIEGGQITQDDFVPLDFNQRDFILNMARLFNLYIYPDPNIPKKIHIEPRDDYYADFDSVDWTKKLDLSKKASIQTLEETKKKTLVYKYKDDPDDYYLNIYRNKYDTGYGTKRVSTGYEFNTEEKDVLNLQFGTAVPIQYTNDKQLGDTNVEIHSGSLDTVYITSFADVTNTFNNDEDTQDPDDEFPRFKRAFIGRSIEILNDTYQIIDLISPWAFQVDRDIDVSAFTGTSYDPTNIAVSNIPFFYNGSQSKVFPAIYKSEDNNLTREQYASVPRILRYSKNIALTDGETYFLQDTPTEVQIIKSDSVYQTYTQTIYEYITATPSKELSIYPFVSHVDDPETPTFDLLFERPQEVFWNILLT